MTSSLRLTALGIVLMALTLAGCKKVVVSSMGPLQPTQCIHERIPAAFNQYDAESNLAGSELGQPEIARLISVLPPGMASAIQTVGKKWWPNEMAFASRGSEGEWSSENTLEFMDDVTDELTSKYHLDACGARDSVAMALYAIVIDYFHSRLRHNMRYNSIDDGTNKNVELAVMVVGASLNGYTSAVEMFSRSD